MTLQKIGRLDHTQGQALRCLPLNCKEAQRLRLMDYSEKFRSMLRAMKAFLQSVISQTKPVLSLKEVSWKRHMVYRGKILYMLERT